MSGNRTIGTNDELMVTHPSTTWSKAKFVIPDTAGVRKKRNTEKRKTNTKKRNTKKRNTRKRITRKRHTRKRNTKERNTKKRNRR